MKTTAFTVLALLLPATSCLAPLTRDPSTVVNIAPAMNQRIVVVYPNGALIPTEDGTSTFSATIVAELGTWYVEGKDGSSIDLPASAEAFVISGGSDPVVTLDGKPVKLTLDKDVAGTKTYSIGADVPQADRFYLVINYEKSVILVEVKRKG